MKKYFLLLILPAFLSGISCEKKIDVEKEEEAIKAVIEEETQAFCDKDFERFAATYVQDETNIRLYASNYSSLYTVGWEAWSSMIKEWIKNNPDPIKNNEVKTNYRIKVFKDCAWAIFDDEVYNDEGEFTDKSIGVNFLEKVDGEWKIVFLSRVNVTSYEEEVNVNEEEPETEDTE